MDGADDIFSGNVPIQEALRLLRLRLLDLTARNRLLNFRHTPGKSLQFVSTTVDGVYKRLVETQNGRVSINPVPDPERMEWILENGRYTKPAPQDYARRLGIDPSYDLAHGTGNGSSVLALYYPEDLAKHCRKLYREAKLAIEETGANMLFLVFGFLEFPETQDSTKTYLAPLISIPVSIIEGVADANRVKSFSLTHTGDDLAENLSLREKLKRDYGVDLPEFDEEMASPEAYLEGFRQAIARRPNWKVRSQLTLALLSFTNMLLVRDLDPAKWPVEDDVSTLVGHPIVRQVFEGSAHSEASYGEEYKVDDHPKGDMPLIYDCDSSQHSALIDAVEGKNLVIEGPPGTGKSQTITNLIAAAIREGKTVLFVAEKLAALQVVKSRLERAALGDFVLELHSNKTHKKRVLDDLAARIKARYSAPPQLSAQLERLQEKKRALKAYAEILNTVTGNQQGLTVHQTMWRAERYRLQCGDQWPIVQDIYYEPAPQITAAEFENMRDNLAHVAAQYAAIGCFDSDQPFWGFFPEAFAPGDDLALQKILSTYARRFDGFAKSLSAAASLLGAVRTRMSRESAQQLTAALTRLAPVSSHEVAYDCLLRLFPETDASGSAAEASLQDFERRVQHVHTLHAATKGKLNGDAPASVQQGDMARKLLAQVTALGCQILTANELDGRVAELSRHTESAQAALVTMAEIAGSLGIPFEGNDHQLLQTEAVLNVVAAAPRDLFFLRHPELLHSQTPVILTQARSALVRLQDTRTALSDTLYLDVVPPDTELTVAILTLREGQTWYRIFQSSWRRAISTHRRLAKAKVKRTVQQRLEDLESLLAHKKATTAWAENSDTKRCLGPHYRGEASPLADTLRLAQWLHETHNICIEHGLQQTVLDPGAVSEARIIELAAMKRRFDAATAVLEKLAGRVMAHFAGAKGFSIDEFQLESWPARLIRLNSLIDGLTKASEFVAAQSPPSISCADSLAAVDASSRIPAAVATVTEDSNVKALLGARFAGMSTLLQPVKAALAYGRLVRDYGLPPAVERVLMSEQAVANREALARVIVEIGAGWEETERFSKAMQAFGAFELGKWVGNTDSHSDYAERLTTKTRTASDNLERLLPWSQYVAARKRACDRGLQEFVSLLEGKQFAAEHLTDAFGYRFYGSIVHSIFRGVPELRRFAGTTHSNVRAEYAKLDKEIIRDRGAHVAAASASRANPPRGTAGARLDERSEMVLLNLLMSQTRPRMPIRKILSRAGRSVQELKPCFMMGPQAVAQFLEPGCLSFDLVIMDEASQLKPEEAIGAIARGSQLIVVGDPKQLPPTTFFSRMGLAATDEEGQQFAALDSESILDVCMGQFQPVRTLRWHYRSHHESLIAFSNHEFYQGNLVIFPSPFPKSKALGLRYRYLPDGIYDNQMNRIEAIRVVDAVIDHILNRREDSLGVVTLNIKQRDLIAELIEERIRNLTQADDYRQYWEDKGFGLFVKNLETVQGDERDVIFISTTFGKAPGTTVVRQNFGPISRDGGWRRLNVLFTRARKSVTVFTSMQPENIVVDGGTPRGTVALRHYLEFARSGILPKREETGLPPDSDFEVAVANVLRSHGYAVTPQLGVAGFRIDIAVRHPAYQSAYLAAIECDGASYHSAVSVRDRDRIRQEILESLGWNGRIWRIWSTDWFRNPAQETARLLSFLAELRKQPIPAEYVTEDQPEEAPAVSPAQAEDEVRDAVPLSLPEMADDDFEIDVGDLVTYRPVGGNEASEMTVQITPRRTDPAMGFIAEATPLAQALMGAVVGDEVVLRVPGREPQRFLIRTVKRAQEEAAVN